MPLIVLIALIVIIVGGFKVGQIMERKGSRNMVKLEVFFDYACPYCLQGHKRLLKLLPKYPQVSVVWRPCEAHPRPETHGPHSDLCIQGMFFALEDGEDLMAYHQRMYRAALEDRIDIESIPALTEYVSDLVDADRFRQALEEGVYKDRLAESNRHAFQRSAVWAVPAYRIDGERLDAIENIGVTEEQLDAFLRDNTQ